jgi:hypothetical protein
MLSTGYIAVLAHYNADEFLQDSGFAMRATVLLRLIKTFTLLQVVHSVRYDLVVLLRFETPADDINISHYKQVHTLPKVGGQVYPRI